MFDKTTSTTYLKYGIVTSSFKKRKDLFKARITVTDDTVDKLTSYDKSVYIDPIEGMGMLRVLKDPELDSFDNFALHRSIKINAGTYFALVPMHGRLVFDIYFHGDAAKRVRTLSTPYKYHHIVPTLRINEILAYYYVVKRPGYVFDGEVHDFYELTYVDHGSLETRVDKTMYQVNANQCILYGPRQFHDQRITSDEACSYMTIIFQADGIHNSSMLNRVFTLTRALLVDVNDFVKATDEVGEYHDDAMIASLQYLLVAMQLHTSNEENIAPTSPINQHFEDQLMEEIVEYINKHLYEPLPVDQVCDRFSISRSTLQNLFRNNLKISPKQYINNAKLYRSRTLIRSGDHTISEVASMLGFNSIHYFSRKFTAYYGVTPSEYSRKIYDQKDTTSE